MLTSGSKKLTRNLGMVAHKNLLPIRKREEPRTHVFALRPPSQAALAPVCSHADVSAHSGGLDQPTGAGCPRGGDRRGDLEGGSLRRDPSGAVPAGPGAPAGRCPPAPLSAPVVLNGPDRAPGAAPLRDERRD